MKKIWAFDSEHIRTSQLIAEGGVARQIATVSSSIMDNCRWMDKMFTPCLRVRVLHTPCSVRYRETIRKAYSRRTVSAGLTVPTSKFRSRARLKSTCQLPVCGAMITFLKGLKWRSKKKTRRSVDQTFQDNDHVGPISKKALLNSALLLSWFCIKRPSKRHSRNLSQGNDISGTDSDAHQRHPSTNLLHLSLS